MSLDVCNALVTDLRYILTNCEDSLMVDFFSKADFDVVPYGILPNYFTLKIKDHYCGFFDSDLPYHDLVSLAERCCLAFYNGYNFGVETGVWRDLIK